MKPTPHRRRYNGPYTGDHLNHIAFPLGGIGAGMISLEGTGSLGQVSLRNKPSVNFSPCIFSAICIKGTKNVARVLEGPVPAWKIFGSPNTGDAPLGLPRFSRAVFQARFPFATVALADEAIPLDVSLTGWSPFIPNDADRSSLPVAALEYRFVNTTRRRIDAVYSLSARNFMAWKNAKANVRSVPHGFVLYDPGTENSPWLRGSFCARAADTGTRVNAAWFRGGFFDSLTMAWRDIESGACFDKPAPGEDDPSPGATLFVPMTLKPGKEKTVRVMLSWYVPKSDVRTGPNLPGACGEGGCADGSPSDPKGLPAYQPWYAGRFDSIDGVAAYWLDNYDTLRESSAAFRDCFYDTTLPPEVIEAVAANLGILRSPTVLRQPDGRLWCWEGSSDNVGCCNGSCEHVWNYAQALAHLFPALERGLRDTEFNESQDERGHQNFRAALPIRPTDHVFPAAADGQPGGVMKTYREWRISGDTPWLKAIWPKLRKSLDFCIEEWDPAHNGYPVEPQHNTYDIEFWGANGMCTGFYLGALNAAVVMGTALGDDVSFYALLLGKGLTFLDTKLYNGDFYYQRTQWQGLRTKGPIETKMAIGGTYSPEAAALVGTQGPKYQYGPGCLSDGVLGMWLSEMCGLGGFADRKKVRSHLRAVYKHNFRRDLSAHVNPQRYSYAMGHEAGLLLCTWPTGGEPALPFPYSNEVWTGIEYQAASHMMLEGMVREGLELVRAVRDRHDGRIRNPFDEYECGHWYARAMSSYGLLQGLTGVRYDAVERTLYVNPSVKGDFKAFLCTATGYGTVGIAQGKPFLEVKQGSIEVARTVVGRAGGSGSGSGSGTGRGRGRGIYAK